LGDGKQVTEEEEAADLALPPNRLSTMVSVDADLSPLVPPQILSSSAAALQLRLPHSNGSQVV
jgi:hypothetical protein